MEIVSVDVQRPLDACWRVFTTPSMLVHWVPGLVGATLVAARPDGLPREVRFEFAAALHYTLLYSYDVSEYVVRWEPREPAHGAVRGFARFESTDVGIRLTYALEHEPGRKAAERVLDDPELLVQSFARYMHEHRD
ncbi:MAG: SRPBCC family protein [Deltaproteobacteria bacterium]|nr:SRPBCC family protein [Deltaproteobacteria bacterium]